METDATYRGTLRFEPRNPDYRAIAADTFERQHAMRTLGISIVRLEPGEGNEILIATMTGTLMALPRRASALLQDKVRATARPPRWCASSDAVQVCAADMVIYRDSFYGRAVHMSLPS